MPTCGVQPACPASSFGAATKTRSLARPRSRSASRTASARAVASSRQSSSSTGSAAASAAVAVLPAGEPLGVDGRAWLADVARLGLVWFPQAQLPALRAGIASAFSRAGLELRVVQEGIPAAIPTAECYLGWQDSLQLLALLVEPEIPAM